MPNYLPQILVLVLLLLVTACATTSAPTESAESTIAASDTYTKLLITAQADPAQTDFADLRLAYSRSPAYDPYLGPENALNTAMFAALQGGATYKALELAQQLLESNYVSIDGHYVAWQCHEALQDSELAAYHRAFLDGLLESIATSGDGTTAETAYQVISNQEMYSFLGLHALDPRGQSVIRAGNRTYNRVSVVDDKRQRKDLYFDITLQVARGIATKND